MDNIAHRLKTYIDTHPFDPGDSNDDIKKGHEYLELVGLQDDANKRIHEISSGQQRTAPARALIVGPKLCLLDETLSNLRWVEDGTLVKIIKQG